MLAVLYSSYTGRMFSEVPSEGEFRCTIPSLPLKQGSYPVGIRVLANGEEADWPQGFVGSLQVAAGDFFGSGRSGFEGAAPLLLGGVWEVVCNERNIERTF